MVSTDPTVAGPDGYRMRPWSLLPPPAERRPDGRPKREKPFRRVSQECEVVAALRVPERHAGCRKLPADRSKSGRREAYEGSHGPNLGRPVRPAPRRDLARAEPARHLPGAGVGVGARGRIERFDEGTRCVTQPFARDISEYRHAAPAVGERAQVLIVQEDGGGPHGGRFGSEWDLSGGRAAQSVIRYWAGRLIQLAGPGYEPAIGVLCDVLRACQVVLTRGLEAGYPPPRESVRGRVAIEQMV